MTATRTWAPNPEQMALRPAVSGNAVNGLGEGAVRRPRMVYWAPNPDDIEHGAMQRWFYSVNPNDAEINAERARRTEIIEAPLPPVAPSPAERSPGEWTDALDEFVASRDCEMVGVARIRAEWVYEGSQVRWKTILLFGVGHAYSEIESAPELAAAREVMRQYTRAAAVAKKAAGWLRGQGWDCEPVTGPMTGAITLIPPALEAGFGELGKHGSIINPELGSSFRLAGVMTDAPFAPTPARTFGIDDFCSACRVCERACPPDAISPDKQLVRGVRKWYVDFDRCLPFFNEHQGCAICIAVCPWSRPGVGEGLAAKLRRRSERLARG